MELTRRALLQGAALTAGALVRPDHASFAVAAQAVSPVTVRIVFLPPATAGREDASISLVPEDGALVRREWPRQPVTRGAPGPHLSEGVRLHVAEDFAVSVTAHGHVVQQLRADLTTNSLSFLLGRGPLLGLGEGGPQFDRRGAADEMRNGQDGYRLHTHGARVPVQWVVGTEGWGLYVHQPLGTLDLTGSEGRFAASTLLPLDVFVVASSDPAVLLREYAVITGYAELPARWTFGYMQSHRTLAGSEEVLGVARTFREKRLPCDALIYLGTEFTPSGWNTRNGEFTWNAGNFPDPQGRHRRAARDALQGRPPHGDRRTTAHRHGRRSVQRARTERP